MKKNVFLLTAVLALAIGGLVLRQQQTSDHPLDKVGTVRLAASLSLAGAPFWVARDRGLFAKAGLDAQFQECAFGRVCAEAMLKGEVDLAPAAEFIAARIAFSDHSLRILGTTAFVHTTKLLGLKEKGIASPADLRGKRVGVLLGTVVEYFLERLLTLNGLGRDEIIWVDLKPGEMAQALDKGQVDAVVIFSPYTRQVKAELPGRLSENDGQPGQDYYYVVLGRQQWLAANGNIAERVMLALKWAEAWMAEHPEEARDFLAAKYGLSATNLDQDLKHTRFSVSLPQTLLSAIEEEWRWLIQRGRPGRPPANSLDLIAFDPLSTVAPEAVTMIRGTPPGLR